MQAVLVAACALLLLYREYSGYLYELLTCTVSMCVASGPSAVLLHGGADDGGARVERGLALHYTTRRQPLKCLSSSISCCFLALLLEAAGPRSFSRFSS
jgi:hypothetical protein